ncbi:MAG: ABC-type transport auxiliary lipoprotein family protein [Burkholderiales bacterium]|nr:ABC-type transport auxiliary lipoprotein family protein [Burkholderiales bacterium]
MMHARLARTIQSTICAAILPLALLLNACSLAPPARQPVVNYDLGPQRAHVPAGSGTRATLMVPAVTAPAWLDSTGIVYRLVYLDAARPQIYALSRWVDSPAALFTQRVRSRFAAAVPIVGGGDGARADYALQIEIEDFSQSFAAADRSQAAIRIRVTLVNLSTRTLHAQRTFSVERPAGPDAEGAARALAQAADAVIESLLEWTLLNSRAG